jgi:hypothetical protein
MRRILDYVKAAGIGDVFAKVSRENRPMLEVCRSIGFALYAEPDTPEVVRAEIALAGWPDLERAAD